jgi:hypothetical protein
MTIQPDGDFVFDFMSTKDRWYSVAIGVGMTTVSVLLVILGGVVSLIIGLIGVVFFGLMCLPYIVFRAIRPGHRLVVGADGFTVNDHALDLGFISWHEVEGIETTSRGPFSWVVVKLRDPAAFLRRHSPVRRALLRLNGKARLSAVRIAGVNLPVPVSDLAEIMKTRRNNVTG